LTQVNASEGPSTHWKIARLVETKPLTCDDIGDLCLVVGQYNVARANFVFFVALGFLGSIAVMRNSQANWKVSTRSWLGFKATLAWASMSSRTAATILRRSNHSLDLRRLIAATSVMPVTTDRMDAGSVPSSHDA
jgi:hypothetical protein